MHKHSLDALVEEFEHSHSFDMSSDEFWNDFEQWLQDEGITIFKCRNCGEKYNSEFSATADVNICKWCSGEEKDTGSLYIDEDILELA